jgi:hypothetical protein
MNRKITFLQGIEPVTTLLSKLSQFIIHAMTLKEGMGSTEFHFVQYLFCLLLGTARWYTRMTSFLQNSKNENDKYIYFLHLKFINLGILLLEKTTAKWR